jgi:hypothetical protein
MQINCGYLVVNSNHLFRRIVLLYLLKFVRIFLPSWRKSLVGQALLIVEATRLHSLRHTTLGGTLDE